MLLHGFACRKLVNVGSCWYGLHLQTLCGLLSLVCTQGGQVLIQTSRSYVSYAFNWPWTRRISGVLHCIDVLAFLFDRYPVHTTMGQVTQDICVGVSTALTILASKQRSSSRSCPCNNRHQSFVSLSGSTLVLSLCKIQAKMTMLWYSRSYVIADTCCSIINVSSCSQSPILSPFSSCVTMVWASVAKYWSSNRC